MSANESTPRSAAPPERAPGGAAARRSRKRLIRGALLVLGPLAVAAGGAYVYMTSGRYVDTENAYVQADKVVVSAEVAGTITDVYAKENQRVEPGDVLFVIDDRPYRAALARADAQLQAVKSYIEGLEASYRQKLDTLALDRTNLAYQQRELARQKGLQEKKLGTDADVDRAQHDYDVAKQQIPIDEQALEQIRAQLGGSAASLTEQPMYLAMKAMRDTAEIDVKDTVVRAPFEGIASKVPVVGQHVAPGAAVMSVVKNHDMWIEANYKETDLTHVCPGQPVEIEVDTYPGREWHGEVQSISQATGAEFSVIPAQNATGNWVKITQRIPVRIAVPVDPGGPALRAGMSATVTIDTGYRRALPAFLRFGRAEASPTAQAVGGCPASETSRPSEVEPTSLTTAR